MHVHLRVLVPPVVMAIELEGNLDVQLTYKPRSRHKEGRGRPLMLLQGEQIRKTRQVNDWKAKDPSKL